MGWIRTYTGSDFDYNDIEHQKINILDIAHALSNICRFSGHTRQFYSVAQHCVLVSKYVYINSNVLSPKDVLELGLCALLHDASEAYLQDLPRPLKVMLTDYKGMEEKLEKRIAEYFGIEQILSDPFKSIIKEVDIRMCVTEAICLHQYDYTWSDQMDPYFTTMEVWSPEKANLMFLEEYMRLIALLRDKNCNLNV